MVWDGLRGCCAEEEDGFERGVGEGEGDGVERWLGAAGYGERCGGWEWGLFGFGVRVLGRRFLGKASLLKAFCCKLH